MDTRPEVLIVGAGPAGVAAALKLARAGVRVLMLEGADYAGAENWSGGVYHADALLAEDVLGRDAWAQAPVERRVVARALFVHDGLTAVGFEARANAGNDYGQAWTVLRPKLDRYLVSRAIDLGATVLPGTTVNGLRWRGQRVVGVNTNRGPVEADVVFIAEGDASGLLAREGLERRSKLHYAQGIKAVMRLPAAEIERRFGVGPGEGVAQEWILRNGKLAGRTVGVDLTAFLYTNRDTLSVGVVLPLDRLAERAAADHAGLFERVLRVSGLDTYLKDAQQVAYGAKIIRAGGVDETPEWLRDGLAVGGGGLGLGQEIPYPNFIEPAIVSGLKFADAVLALRGRGDFNAAELAEHYAAPLKRTPEYANAQLIRRWPGAIHGGLLFNDLPALLGQLAETETLPPRQARAQRRRALAVQLGRLHRALPQALKLAWGMWPGRAPRDARPPLTVRFLVSRGGAAPVAASWGRGALLSIMADAIGHFYGRGDRAFRDRLTRIWRGLWRAPAALPTVLGLAASGVAGGFALIGDLAAYKIRKLPLRELLTRPYHRHEDAAQRALDWAPARAAKLSPVNWIAPLGRPQPDHRHISVALELGPQAARQLRNVCPAEVYSVTGPLGGVASQYENCIKCESCRVTVPGVDWNRLGRHRLVYRVPGDGRYGLDGSVEARCTLAPPAPLLLPADSLVTLRALHDSLRNRPAMVAAEWPQAWRALLARLPDHDSSRALTRRLGAWLDTHHYGWMEQELRAWLGDAGALPGRDEGVREPEAHARVRREHGWNSLRRHFDSARLKALAERDWDDNDSRALLAFIGAARVDREHAVAWLAQWAPALAWVVVNHYLAEDYASAAIDDVLAAPLWREQDQRSNWLPGPARRLVDARGRDHERAAAVAHGAGLDAARPWRMPVAPGLSGFGAGPDMARLTLALARGQAAALRERAVAYASGRVQFRGELKDAEGRDGVAKFGGVKRMLAIIEESVAVLDEARGWCKQEPAKVLALVRDRMGPWMDAVPWLAGQVFGGMAYSEEDILAPHYRHAILLSQWPGAAELTTEDPEFEAELAAARRAGTGPGDYAVRDGLATFVGHRRRQLRSRQPEAGPASTRPSRGSRPLLWDANHKYQYQSGSFLGGQLLTPERALLPEHFRRDARLRQTRAEVLRLLRTGFKDPDRRLPYGRYIDSLHGMPEADITRLREFNAFASVVPETYGGKGWCKAQYSVLTNLCMGEKDTAVGLLIMASTSIGTMPVILGLDKDIAKLSQELERCLADDDAWRGLAGQLDGLIAMLARPDPKTFRAALESLGKRVQRMFLFHGATLKYVARAWLLQMQQAVNTAKARDLEALAPQLRTLRDGVTELRERFARELAELPARRGAHERFLRFLANGQISAFALTEPAAGSDTGGVQTRAVLREVRAEIDAHGFYRFVPHGGAEPRMLLDAERLMFSDRSVSYRLADGRLGRLDDGDWDMQAQRGRRLVRVGDESFPYHDIGTVVHRNGASWYRYWEVTGNKMWITNGSVADRYSLYSSSPDGDIALMVERRSEGLRIGPNENKLGQRASPTNELTLDRVRVSADQLIGYAGHGQVNALETLSVGRGGLVMGCTTLAEKLLHDFPEVWRRDPYLHAVAQAEFDRLQTLGARLVGLMDRVDLMQGDFRIEAALSKYLASEGLHRIIAWFEKIDGPMAASSEQMIEKWRRDARILNIYEGTNEVQRFLVLKDLPSLLKQELTPVVDNEALNAALQAFRGFAKPRIDQLGAHLWQDPDRQAAWFPVVDWVAELYCWCALHERIRALTAFADPADLPNIARLRALETTLAQHVQDRAEQVRSEFALADSGAGHPADAALTLARAALNAQAEAAADPAPVAVGAVRGDWGVLLRARIEFNAAGQPVWAGWHEADSAVLDRLLAWADRFPEMHVKVAALAPRGFEDRVKRLVAAGAEVMQIVQPTGLPDGVALADALLARWPTVNRWACGWSAKTEEQAPVLELAARLGARLLREVQALGESADGGSTGLWIEDGAAHVASVPAGQRVAFAWDIKPSGRADRFSVARWLDSLGQPITQVDLVAPAGQTLKRQAAAASADVPDSFSDPAALATWVRARLGEGAQPESAAALADGAAPPAVTTLWIAPAAGLAAVRASAALRLIKDLRPAQYGLFTWSAAAGDWPAVSRWAAQSGFQGLWRQPVPAAAGAAPLAAAIAAAHGAVQHYVLDAGDLPLAATLAARLKLPLRAGVLAMDGGSLTRAVAGATVTEPLPPRAVLVAAREYRAAVLAEGAASLPARTLAALDVPKDALADWQTLALPDRQGLAAARIIVDVGLGVADEHTYHNMVEPLCAALTRLSGVEVEVGATRKITQELKLLPVDRQIGQTGIAVAPDLVLALGVSGAPQHMGWIDPRALVVAINRDPTAPIFRWHRENPGPRVIRAVGDLRSWLPSLVQALSAGGDSK